MLYCELCEIFKAIYFANVWEGIPLKNKIFTRVSLRKNLGFYYKWNRQLLYYEGTSSYIPLKILEHVSRVIFQSSFDFLLLNIPQQTKRCSKSATNGCFRDVFRLSLKLAWRIFLKSVTESKFRKSSGVYVNSSEIVCNGVCF